MNNTNMRKTCAAILVVLIAFSMFFVSFNNLKVDAATVDSNAYCSNSTSSHNIPSSITNVCGPMNSSTYGYTVGNTGDWMCVSPQLSSPTGRYGRVESVINSSSFTTNRDSLKPFQDKRLSVSQVVYGCCALKNSDWGLAHAVLSYVVNNDATWLNRLTEGGMGFVVREFSVRAANAGLSVSRDYTYYVFTPNGTYTYQRLVNTAYTPTEHPEFASVTFNKVDANGTPLNGAVIQFVGNTAASASSLTATCNFTRIDNGIEFLSTGSTIQIDGLKPNCTYRFRETSAPTGYSLSSDIVVTVDSNCRVVSTTGTGSTVTMVDYEELVGTVIFHKVDNSGNNLQSAVITFSEASDNMVPNPMGSITYTAGDGVQASFDGTTVRFITANVSDQITITGLKPNARYVFHEESAPEGYISDLDQIVIVDAEGNVSPNGGNVTFRDNVDTNHYGSMRFFKNFESSAGDLIDTVNLYVYQDGYDAPFIQMESTRRFRMAGDYTFWFGNDRLSLEHLSDSSHFGVQSPIEMIDRVDENGDHWYSLDTNHGGDNWSSNGWAYTVTGLPESMYTVEEDWIVASFNSLSSSERVAIEGLNCDGWIRLPSYIDDQGNYHVRFRSQVLIAYTGNGDAGLNHSVYDPQVGFLNSYGAVQINNSESTVPFDVTKIQHGRDVSELSFELWTMNGSNPSNHIATGNITTSAIAPDTYSVNWNYTLHQYVITGNGPNGYEGAWQDLEYTNADTINHLPLGRYQLREYSIAIGAYAVPEGWERITDSTGTYFATVLDYTNVQAGYNIHPLQMVTVENRTGMIRVFKTDLWTGLPLSNYTGTLTFELYDENGALLDIQSDDNRDGVVDFDLGNIYPNGVFPDSFYVLETSAPDGYFVNNNRIPVSMENGYAEVSVADAPYTACVTIYKLDYDTSDTVLFAGFTVYVDSNSDGIHQDNEPIATSFIGNDIVEASVEFNGTNYVTSELRPGHYVIVETNLPDGYLYVDEEGNPTNTPNSASIYIEDQNPNAVEFVVREYEITMNNIKPDVHTTLMDTDNGSHNIVMGNLIQLTDIVDYTNLIVNQEYTLEGRLINKETGEVLLDLEGNELVATTTFVPESSDGTAYVNFVVNTDSIIDGASNCFDLVCFEILRQGERVLVIHANINDNDQTVHIGPEPTNTPTPTPPTNTPTPEITPYDTPSVTPSVTPGNTPSITTAITPNITPELTPGTSVTPHPSTPPVPTTGEDVNSIIYIGCWLVLIGAAGIFAGGIVYRKRKSTN